MSKKKVKDPIEVFILIDRSYSMINKWEETLGSVTEYVKTLHETGAKANVTVATFDQNIEYNTSTLGGALKAELPPTYVYNTFDIIRDRVPVDKFANIEPREVRPRGGTPLYDAAGLIADYALTVDAKKTVLVIVTDGAENSSRTHSLTSIRGKLDELTSRGWEILFLGAEFNIDRVAFDLGFDLSKSIVSSKENMSGVMDLVAMNTINYAYGNQAVNFSYEDKLAASGGKHYA